MSDPTMADMRIMFGWSVPFRKPDGTLSEVARFEVVEHQERGALWIAIVDDAGKRSFYAIRFETARTMIAALQHALDRLNEVADLAGLEKIVGTR